MASTFQISVPEFRDNQGKIHRGKLYIGTFGNDAKATHGSMTLYSDESETVEIANPIDLDLEGSAGAEFWVPGGKYSYSVYDSSGKLAKGAAKATGNVDSNAAAVTNFDGTLDADGYLVGTLSDSVTEVQVPVKGSTFDGAYIEGAQAADGVAGGWTEVLAYYNGLDTPVAIPANIKVFGDTDGNVYQFTGANPNSDPESDGGTNWTRLTVDAGDYAAADTTALASANAYTDSATAAISPIGVHDIQIKLNDATLDGASVSQVAYGSTDNIDALEFENSATDGAYFTIVLPKSWDLGDIDVDVFWLHASSSGDVVWGLESAFHGTGSAMGALDSPDEVTQTSAGAGLVNRASFSSHTISGTPADGGFITLKITRDGNDGSDTLGASAFVLAVLLKYTVDQGNDA